MWGTTPSSSYTNVRPGNMSPYPLFNGGLAYSIVGPIDDAGANPFLPECLSFVPWLPRARAQNPGGLSLRAKIQPASDPGQASFPSQSQNQVHTKSSIAHAIGE